MQQFAPRATGTGAPAPGSRKTEGPAMLRTPGIGSWLVWRVTPQAVSCHYARPFRSLGPTRLAISPGKSALETSRLRSPLQNLRACVLAPLAVMGAAVAAYATFLRRADLEFFNDWDYFNALSLVVRSSVLGYGRMPLHNPWVCGGMDLLANPQSRVFSPLLLADVVLPPQWANLAGLIAYSALGLLGMSLLLRRLGTSPGIAFAGGLLFINGEWFGLHYTDGHIPCGSMQLLPLLVYFAMTCGQRRSLLLLVLTLLLLLLDGGIYTIIFAMLLLSTVLCL